MKVKDILEVKGHSVWSVRPDASVYEAMALMAAKGVGALMVMEGESVAGVISERDSARKVILNRRSKRPTEVKGIMTRHVLYAEPEQTIEQGIAVMTNKTRRHLADIAKEVDLSSPAVMERVKKLESSGIIKGYQAVLDPKKVGKDVTAFVGVSVAHQKYIDAFSALMMRQRDVLECHHVTGEESFIL